MYFKESMNQGIFALFQKIGLVGQWKTKRNIEWGLAKRTTDCKQVGLHIWLPDQLCSCIAEAIMHVKITNAMSYVIPSYFLKYGDKLS